MRTLNRAGAMLLLLALATPAIADTVTIGTHDTPNGFPFGAASGINPGTRYQQVYDSGEFSGPINISAITFFLYSGTTFRSADYEVRLSTSKNPVNGLSSTFDANVGADDKLFQTLSLSGSAGDLTISGAGFDYDPADGDLLLDMIITNGGSTPSELAFFEAMSDSGGLFSRMHDFGEGFDDRGLVTQFTYTAQVIPLPPAAGMGLALLGSLALLRRLRKRR